MNRFHELVILGYILEVEVYIELLSYYYFNCFCRCITNVVDILTWMEVVLPMSASEQGCGLNKTS